MFLGFLTILLITAFVNYNNHSSKGSKPIKTVQTAYGKVSGIPSRLHGIEVFRGIPYAAPPIGSLSWKAPQPPKKWNGILKADHFCNNCMQASQA